MQLFLDQRYKFDYVELFNEIKSEMAKIDNSSKVLLYGVASLICDFFENKGELINHLKQFFELLKYEKHDSS